MGTTLSSIHILSDKMPEVTDVTFRSFSPGWFTCTDSFDAERNYKLARTISRKNGCTVLFFSVFDSDFTMFSFFDKGKKVVDFSTDSASPKGISKIPELIGDTRKGSHKRISVILKCSDDDLLVSLLEEYFGVALLVFDELLGNPEELARKRDDRLYAGYLEEYKKICGKDAAVTATLVKEMRGKVFYHKFGGNVFSPRHHFYFGYETPRDSDRTLRYVCFTGEELIPSAEPDAGDFSSLPAGPRFENIFLHVPNTDPDLIFFNENAPDPYKLKVIKTPRGFYFFSFDGRGNILFTDYKRTLLVMNVDEKVIARVSLKGDPTDFRDEYILTAGFGSEWAHEYSPTDYIRIYKLNYK